MPPYQKLPRTESYNESSHQIEADADKEVGEVRQENPMKIAVQHDIGPVQVHVRITIVARAAVQVTGHVRVGRFVTERENGLSFKRAWTSKHLCNNINPPLAIKLTVQQT